MFLNQLSFVLLGIVISYKKLYSPKVIVVNDRGNVNVCEENLSKYYLWKKLNF